MTFPRTEGYRADLDAMKEGKLMIRSDLYVFQNGKFHGESMYLKNARHGQVMDFVARLAHGWYSRRYRIDARARLLVYEGLFRD